MKLTNNEGVKKLTEVAVKKLLADETKSKSNKMVELFLNGYDVKEIATLMNVRYNFVYNVTSNYCNVNGIKLESTKKEGKKELIIAMHKEGKTPKEISIELKTNINYVYNTIKEVKNNSEAANQ